VGCLRHKCVASATLGIFLRAFQINVVLGGIELTENTLDANGHQILTRTLLC